MQKFKLLYCVFIAVVSISNAMGQGLETQLNRFYKFLYKPLPSKPEIVDSLGFNVSNNVVKPAGETYDALRGQLIKGHY